ncbi:RNA polymerase sigma factor [Desulfococcaceae bacterium HSG7]|nr:RNA polymerase sigma factor [Desulfococcaceae bacterium HSG7]
MTNNIYAPLSGADLMIRYQQGDIAAFDHLYNKYKSLVYGYLMKRLDDKTEAEEIFQDVFLRLHRSRSGFNRKYPFKPWLFAILKNSLTDHYRKSKKAKELLSLDEMETPPPSMQVKEDYNPDPLVPKEIALSANQRKAVELRYGEDFSFEEIAGTLDTTASNVRQLVSRALKNMRKHFEFKGLKQ